MKVGTDGVLLGAWATIPERGRILDIGTGTGLIALMAAQRSATIEKTVAENVSAESGSSEKRMTEVSAEGKAPTDKSSIYIDAIEIEPSAVVQARENFSASPWSSRINLIEGDIFQYNPPHRYDAIICNPPFFINSLENPDPERRTARHWSDEFSHEALLRHVATNLLAPSGTFALILPATEAENLLTSKGFTKFSSESPETNDIIINQNFNTEPGGNTAISLRLSRLTKVRPLPDRDPNRYLIEFVSENEATVDEPARKQSELTAPTLTELTLYDAPNIRSSAYSALAKDFYL